MLFALNKGKKAFITLILTILIVASIPILMPTKTNAAANTRIKILPVQNTFYANTTSPGDTFVVNATVDNVTDLQNWQIKLTWDPTVLNFTSATRPTDHVFAMPEPFKTDNSLIAPSPIIETGAVTWGCTYINANYWTFNGTGTLCQITLKILTPTALPSTCNLTLVNPTVDTILLDGAAHDIPFDIEQGYFTYVDNLAVTLSTPSSTVKAYENVTFTANATDGALPYKYKWYLDTVEVPAAENQSTWVFNFTTSGNPYVVKVNVTDSLGVSAASQLTVSTSSMVVELLPKDTTVVDPGDTVTFNANATSGVPPIKYEWFLNKTLIPAAANITTYPITFNTTGDYYVNVTATGSDGKTATNLPPSHIVVLPPAGTTAIRVVPVTGLQFYNNMTTIGAKILYNITIENVQNLETWQIKLTWNSTMLSFSSATLPTDHVFAGAEEAGKSIITPSPIVNPGDVTWGATYINGAPGAPDFWAFNGTGTLCQIELEIIQDAGNPSSSCTIALAGKYTDTYMVRLGTESIPFNVANTTFTYHWIIPEQLHLLLLALMIASLMAVILIKSPLKKKWIK